MKYFHIYNTRTYLKGEIQMIEYAKDEIFTIRYHLEKDRLKYPVRKRVKEQIRRHKVLTLFFMMGMMFTMLDIVFIYYFFSLLTKI